MTVFAFSLLIGFITGASNTPIAEVLMLSLSGLILSLVGLIVKQEVSLKIKFDSIEVGFIALSFGAFSRTIAGDSKRIKKGRLPAKKEVARNNHQLFKIISEGCPKLHCAASLTCMFLATVLPYAIDQYLFYK